MRYDPTDGPPFELDDLGSGDVLTEPRRGLAERFFGYALRDGHTALTLRRSVLTPNVAPFPYRWDPDQVQARCGALTGVRFEFSTRRPGLRAVVKSVSVAKAAPPPPTKVLPPPRKRQQQKADPSPAATAFKNASKNGTATVCKGPCEACGQA